MVKLKREGRQRGQRVRLFSYKMNNKELLWTESTADHCDKTKELAVKPLVSSDPMQGHRVGILKDFKYLAAFLDNKVSTKNTNAP